MPRLDNLRLALFANPDDRGANPHVVHGDSPEAEGKRLNAMRYETLEHAAVRRGIMPPLGNTEPDTVAPPPYAPNIPPPDASLMGAIGAAALVFGGLFLLSKVIGGPKKNPIDDDEDDDFSDLDDVIDGEVVGEQVGRTAHLALPGAQQGVGAPPTSPVVVVVHSPTAPTISSTPVTPVIAAPSISAPPASPPQSPVAPVVSQTVVAETVTKMTTRSKPAAQTRARRLKKR